MSPSQPEQTHPKDCECKTCVQKIYEIFDEAYENDPEIRRLCDALGLKKKRKTPTPNV